VKNGNCSVPSQLRAKMHLNDKNTLCEFLSFKCILACMSWDFGIFMPKHLAVQWLLNSYEECYKYYKHLKEKSKRKKK
jgi:hypothetical protein